MNVDEHIRRTTELFAAALRESPSQRDAFLRRECGNDTTLLAYLKSLVFEHERYPESTEVPPPTCEVSLPPVPLSPIDPRTIDLIQPHFEILDRRGEGAMGVVYRARNRETGEIQAIKILKPAIASDPAAVERFKNEILLTHRIAHKNVCRTHDLYQFDGVRLIAMEFVEGDSLRVLLQRVGAVSVPQGLKWAAQICDALAEAHDKGVIHRDLKPENVMIDQKGDVKLMDFGIARSIEPGSSTTGTMIGTPGYMCPEQVLGKAVDPCSDVYSLGLVLYEMFTGKQAYQGDTVADLLYKQIHENPPPPREVNPYIPDYIDHAIRRCLEKDPRARPHSIHELIAALNKTSSRAPEPTPFPGHLAAPRPSDVFLLALGALGLAAFIIMAGQIVPEAGLRIQRTKQQFLIAAREELASRGPYSGGLQLHVDRDVYPNDTIDTDLDVNDETNPYDFLAEERGYVIARDQLIRRFPPYLYHVDSGARAADEAGVLFEPSGAIRMVVLPIAGSAHEGLPAPGGSVPQLIRQGIQKAFGVNPDDLEVESNAPEKEEYRQGYKFIGVKRDSNGVNTRYEAYLFDHVDLGRWDKPPADYGRSKKDFYYDTRLAWLALMVLSLLLVKRSFHGLQLSRMLVLAGVGLAWGLFTPLSVSKGASGGPQLADELTFGAIGMFGFVLLSGATTFLAEGVWRHVTASYSALIQGNAAARPVGLALVRGAACGALLLGLYSALMEVAIQWHLTWPRLQDYYRDLNSSVPGLTVLAVALGNAALIAFFLGCVLAMARRWTSLRPLLAAVGAGVWVAGMNSPTLGPLPPDMFQLVLTFVLVVGFCYFMLAFDLLTLLAAAFTFQLWLHGYALTQMYEVVGNEQVWLVFALWGGLVAWAAMTAFHWSGVGRRLARVFE